MTDIVERLRQAHTEHVQATGGTRDPEMYRTGYSEAADEIEALRTVVCYVAEEWTDLAHHVARELTDGCSAAVRRALEQP